MLRSLSSLALAGMVGVTGVSSPSHAEVTSTTPVLTASHMGQTKSFRYTANGLVECTLSNGSKVCRTVVDAGIVYAPTGDAARIQAEAKARAEFSRQGRIVSFSLSISGSF